MESDETMPWEILSAIVGLSTLETQNNMRLVSKSMKDTVTRNTMKENLPMKDIWWKMRGKEKLYKLREIDYFNEQKDDIKEERWYDNNGELHREGNKPAVFTVNREYGGRYMNKNAETLSLEFVIHGKNHNVPEPTFIDLDLKILNDKPEVSHISLRWYYEDRVIAALDMKSGFHNLYIMTNATKMWKQYFSDWFYSQPSFHYFGYTIPNPYYNAD